MQKVGRIEIDIEAKLREEITGLRAENMTLRIELGKASLKQSATERRAKRAVERVFEWLGDGRNDWSVEEWRKDFQRDNPGALGGTE